MPLVNSFKVVATPPLVGSLKMRMGAVSPVESVPASALYVPVASMPAASRAAALT